MSRHRADGFSTAGEHDEEVPQTDYHLPSVKSPSRRYRRNTMKSSTKDQAEGTFHKIKGKVKEVVGELSENPELEAEGKVEKIAGKVQEKIGQVEKVLEK
jgi:uncharacterized protein YjbJ (UPF0337 family)